MAQNWSAPARELADTIVAHLQSRSGATLSLRNLSSMTPNEAAKVRKAVEDQLRIAGVRLVSADRAVDEIRLTLSENANGYLWVAEVGHGDSWDIVMITAGSAPPREASGTGVTVRKKLQWTQPDLMLDFALLQMTSGPAVLVLEPDRLALYSLADRTNRGIGPINHSQDFPRDVRGRLSVQPDGGFVAYLPGVQCTGVVQPRLISTCSENDNAWPLGSNTDNLRGIFNWSRNYFTGALVPGLGGVNKLPPFYTAAAFQERGTTMWLFTLLDGSTRLVSSKGENLGVIGGSGSDVAAIRSECSQDFLVLATRPGDETRPDAVQAFEMTNGEPSEAGASAEFPGPLLSLWTASDGNAVTAIARNLKTMQYEAFLLTVTCGR